MTGSRGARSRAAKLEEAARELAGRDPVLARLLAEFGPPVIPAPSGTAFQAMVRSVVYQQLAGAAAGAIHGRLVTAMDGEVTPERLLALSPADLRAAGLSARKAVTLTDLAERVLDGRVPLEPRRLGRTGDAEIVASLSEVKGIGRWSAEMLLMFHLCRTDVWPVGDLAVRRGFGLAWGIPEPTPRQLDALGEAYHPYRSIVAWYCWRVARRYGRTAASAVTA
jgi:DNA-3-methyladenine glycosylase II